VNYTIVTINRLGIEAEAEECVQDVFVSLWRRRHEIELRYSLSTYLWVAVKHQVINRLDNRYAKRTLRTTELVDETIVPSSEEQLLEKELREQIAATVSRLPEKCRMVYRLSREEGKSNKEIAEELNISEKTVYLHTGDRRPQIGPQPGRSGEDPGRRRHAGIYSGSNGTIL
jgi:RNA polymerase sigma-70 factor (ECF subfamily)